MDNTLDPKVGIALNIARMVMFKAGVWGTQLDENASHSKEPS